MADVLRTNFHMQGDSYVVRAYRPGCVGQMPGR